MKHKKLILVMSAFVFIFLFLRYQNKHLVVTCYNYTKNFANTSLADYRIVQISDLHNTTFGKNNKRLLEKISALNPDIIVITGDIIDSNHTNIDVAITFAKNALKICPVYYVNGNHEVWLSSDKKTELEERLGESGVTILTNDVVTITKGDASFNLIGLREENLTDQTLQTLLKGHEDATNVLLAHEPQLISTYAKSNVDLVLSGHAHGGQFRLPLVGGLIAPDQGFFPDYTSGIYKSGSTEMIVSRGLGNSVVPFRLFNPPEIVCIEFK